MPVQQELFAPIRNSSDYKNSQIGVWSQSNTKQQFVEHAPGCKNCAACERVRTMYAKPLQPEMLFAEAAPIFLATRTAPETLGGRIQYISPRTLSDYRNYLKPLTQHFGALRLDEIHIGHIVEFQRRRSLGEGFTRVIGNRKGGTPVPSPCGAVKINSELAVLKLMMTEAGAWTPELTACYRRFQQLDSEIEPALSPAQQEHFMRVAASNPDWCRVFWYFTAGFHLTFSSDEMRTLRIADFNPAYQIIGVNRRYGKNKKRRREIPIGDAGCIWALERMIEWNAERGGGKSHHFLLPFRARKGEWDHERPMSSTGLRKPFEEVRAAAGLPWFKLNGMRHTAITRLAEQGVPMAIIKARAGHMTDRMSDHYTHISEQAHRLWITPPAQRKADGAGPVGGYTGPIPPPTGYGRKPVGSVNGAAYPEAAPWHRAG